MARINFVVVAVEVTHKEFDKSVFESNRLHKIDAGWQESC